MNAILPKLLKAEHTFNVTSAKDYLNHLRLAVDILQISESSKQLQEYSNNLNRENLNVD